MNRVYNAYTTQANPLDVLAKLRKEQETAIQDGVDTGTLTTDETKSINTSQDALNTRVKKASEDGEFSAKELRDIQQALRQAGQEVYALTHNKTVVKKGPEEVLKSQRESQEKQIQKGVDSGAITPDEAKRLRQTQDALARMEEKAKADGVISVVEMHDIQRARKDAARDIHTLSHNKSIAKKTPSDSLAAMRKAQEEEIAAGVDSGAITSDEAKRLRNAQAAIAKMDDRARTDGKVTAKELQLIKNARDYQEQQIYTLANNKAVVTKQTSSATTLDKQV